jgi:IS4 transposase
MGKKAFFLSRLDCSTNVYDESGKLISFSDIYKSMNKAEIIEQEKMVYIGKQTKVPVRLIIRIVPDEVYAQRIRTKTSKSKGQGRGQLKKETKIRSRFNLFITNADESRLPIEKIFPLYRLRWQVEIHFSWKVKKENRVCLKCYSY